MIVVIIVALLAGVALPSYQEYIRKAKRVDAKTALLDIRLLQEKYRTNNPTYGTLVQIGAASTSADGHYTIAVLAGGNAPTATTYIATAAPVGGGDMAGDSCGTFAVNQDGQLYTGYASVVCWE